MRRKCEDGCSGGTVFLHNSIVVRHFDRIVLLDTVDEDLANPCQLVLPRQAKEGGKSWILNIIFDLGFKVGCEMARIVGIMQRTHSPAVRRGDERNLQQSRGGERLEYRRLERGQSKHIVEYFRLAGQDADVESEQGASDREGNQESTRDHERSSYDSLFASQDNISILTVKCRMLCTLFRRHLGSTPPVFIHSRTLENPFAVRDRRYFLLVDGKHLHATCRLGLSTKSECSGERPKWERLFGSKAVAKQTLHIVTCDYGRHASRQLAMKSFFG